VDVVYESVDLIDPQDLYNDGTYVTAPDPANNAQGLSEPDHTEAHDVVDNVDKENILEDRKNKGHGQNKTRTSQKSKCYKWCALYCCCKCCKSFCKCIAKCSKGFCKCFCKTCKCIIMI
ncbi:unnamed protein product, partial [Meganyctiphanes norvegica]